MNILVLGSGKGSFTMRGEQLGAALGARVTSHPTSSDWTWADVIVLVKRAGLHFAAETRKAGVPMVWDALDFWRQPAENGRSEKDARHLFGAAVAEIRPALTIGATQAMADACQGVCLPHHSWAGLDPMPAREHVEVVAYEGNPAYLGVWASRLRAACERRGWTFAVNPPDLRQVDIFVAFRDGEWDGFMCREWKSGVKAGNAIAAGRPFIGQPSAALRELNPTGATVTTLEELETAFDAWTPREARAAVVDVCRFKAPALKLSAIAAQYRAALEQVRATCAA